MEKTLLHIYSIVLSTFVLLWGIYVFVYDRRKRVKIFNSVRTNCLIGNMKFSTLWSFRVVNTGAKPIVIIDAFYRFNDTKSYEYYFKPEQNDLPVSLSHGEVVNFTIDYTDYDHLIDRVKANKLQMIVIDSIGRQHKTKWVDIKRFPYSSGSLSQTRPNHSYVIGRNKSKSLIRITQHQS